MPIRLNDLQKDERTCAVEFEGETAQIRYRPSGYTPAVEAALQDAIESNRLGNGLADLLTGLLAGWEVLDENGEELPVDRKTLAHVPSSFLAKVVQTITADMNTERDDRKNSGGGSPRKASKGAARTGTRSSGRRATFG